MIYYMRNRKHKTIVFLKELMIMNYSPCVYCPFCGMPLKVMDTIPTVTSEGVKNMSICKCGVLDVVIRQNKVVAIRVRNPELLPDVRILEY